MRPFVNVGGGWEFQQDSSALIYSVGASTSYRLSNGGGLISAVGGKLVWAARREAGGIVPVLTAASGSRLVPYHGAG